MKIIKFREVCKTFNIHVTSSSDCIYIPNKKIILYELSRGSFCNTEYGSSNDAKHIEHIEKLLRGESERDGNCFITDIQYLDVAISETQLRELITVFQDLKTMIEIAKGDFPWLWKK